ncbi:succinate dehydrogenase (or fumarate reductase) cytochrome b subunit, b558 family [Pirellula staleyi DSM 6068]|uniref:Succinate dehydrogenase (Or fumarate reductase) cytochrome b subunit, b558 family n=1 Tax=Pirellula staleyi (strain ATCC 27377 / DSM 6068 / ICPB 4128) TaxID=530564 RepID=D2R6H1_PIRSD|nr:succinate dehydrogenase cytochrome b558 subunit [Pirellula staleyi]ADB15549.1 succinate dehydrogenase (or fumarate reductase) cytochrome b subunit, b558 family [Pirellula staleyi DSM 6068]
MKEAPSSSFLARNEFLIRRLHSLTGLVPVGAYMCVHLLTNASVLDSGAAFQKNVYMIHSLGAVLPVVEWGFIFLPLLFHAIFGVVIVRGGLPNSSTYKYTSNIRYTLQRASGMVAFAFIMWHVFHMHGWFHAEWWQKGVAEPLSGAMFKPYSAASTAAEALQISIIVPVLYVIGVLSCVFHLANGIWTFGITWGIWVSPAAQTRATWACLVFGLALSAVGLGALGGFATKTKEQIAADKAVEQKMFDAKVASGEVEADSHKFGGNHQHAEGEQHEAPAEEKPAEEAATATEATTAAPAEGSTETSIPAAGAASDVN